LVGLYLILVLEAAARAQSAAVSVLCLAFLDAYGVVLALSFTREFSSSRFRGPAGWLTVAGGAGLAVLGLWLTDERFAPGGEARGSSPAVDAAAEVDEPIDRANHQRPSQEIPDRHRHQVVEEKGSPGQA
jgi:hypothetical protein